LARTLAEFIGARTSKDGVVVLPDDVTIEPALSALRKGLAAEPSNRPADAQAFGHLLDAAREMFA
jgi:hypothetical protein